MERFERDSRSLRTGPSSQRQKKKRDRDRERQKEKTDREREKKGGRGETSELQESRATGSGIFVAPLFECSGEDDREYIVAKRSSLREPFILSFNASHNVTKMILNMEIEGTDRVDKS